MKSAFWLAATFAGLVTSSSAIAQGQPSLWQEITSSKVLKTCVLNYAPNSFKNKNGEWRGFSVSMAQDVAKTMNVSLTLVETTAKTVTLDIQSGRCHVIFGLSITPERNVALDFAGPLYSTAIAIAPRQGFKIPGDKWTDISKPEIRASVIQGSGQEKKLERYGPNATKIALTTVDEAVLALQSGRADIYVSALFELLAAKSKMPSLGDVVILQPTRPTPSYAVMRFDSDGRFSKFLNHWAEFSRTNGLLNDWIVQALEETGIKRSDIPANVEY